MNNRFVMYNSIFCILNFTLKIKSGRVSRPAIVIATAGVAIGLCVMIMTLCITSGFKQQVHAQVRSVGGDMHIVNTGSLYKGEGVSLPVTDEALSAIRSIPGIEHVDRVVTVSGCLKTDSAFAGMMLCGVDGAAETQLSNLGDNEIAVSTTIASRLRLRVGDKVMAYFFDDNIRARRLIVAATYATHFSNIDDIQVFASYATVHALAGLNTDECSFLRVYDSAGAAEADTGDGLPRSLQVLQHVRQLIPITPECQTTVLTLDEMYPQLSWLDLLDTNVAIIIVLMLCVSGFTMASGLFILILERTQMIGLMKALGARFSTLRGIFLCIAGVILLKGMLIGNLLALLLAFVQSQWHVLRLNPVDYYVEFVPVVFPWMHIAVLNLGTLLLTLLVLLVPTCIIGRISPVKALHFD